MTSFTPSGLPRLDRPTLALTALFGILYAWNLETIELSDTDEGRSGVIVRDMVEGGNWLLPRTPDGYLCEKPPAYYGTAAILGSAFGIREATLRGVSIAAALFCLLSTWMLARLFSTSRAAGLAVVLLGSNILFLFSARQAMVDMTLTCFVTLGLLFYFAARQGRLGRWPAAALSGAAFGLAILSKGPIGIVLPGAVVAVDALLATRGRLGATRPAWGPAAGAVLLAAAVSMAWYLPGIVNGGAEFLETCVLSENFRMPVGRAEGIGVAHRKSIFYYFNYQLVAILPALPLLPTLMGWIRDRESDPARRQLGAWILGGFALFLLAANKRFYYLVPLQPPVAVAIALAVERALARGSRRLLAIPAAVMGALLALAALGAATLVAEPSLLQRLGRGGAYEAALGDHQVAVACAAAVLLGTGVAMLVAARKGGDAVVRAAAVLAAALIGCRVGAGDPLEAEFDHTRSFVRAAVRDLPPGPQPVILPPIHGYAMEFYWPDRLVRDERAALNSEVVLVQRPNAGKVPDLRQEVGVWKFRDPRKDVLLLRRRPP